MHELAEQLEHVSSPRLIDKLDVFLNHPRFDPHGDPIPDKNGNIILQKKVNLLSLEIKQTAEICAVSEQESSFLEIMKEKKLSIGTRIEMKKKFEYDNSVELKIAGNKTVHISEKIAKVVFVKMVK